jgi:hypothetical protein
MVLEALVDSLHLFKGRWADVGRKQDAGTKDKQEIFSGKKVL